MKILRLLAIKLVLPGLLFIIIYSCKKEDPVEAAVPVLSTIEVAEVTLTTAKSGGEITSDLGATVTSRGICWSTDPEPTIIDHKTNDGSGAGLFTSSLSGLLPGSTYYVRAYATNSNGTGYGNAISFTTPEAPPGSFTDPRDGSIYKTVTIGDQIWMAENLRYLPSVTTPVTSSYATPCYYVYGYYGTDVEEAVWTSNYKTYGALYNWISVMAGANSSTANPSGVTGVCPPGWHLPSLAEWIELVNHLGGFGVAGSKLKEEGTAHWHEPNIATNETGFTALPGGGNGKFFSGLGMVGLWWTATDPSSGASSAWMISLYHSSGEVFAAGNVLKEGGAAVRCLKDI